MPGQLEHPGDRLEDLVGEDDPATGRARAARSPPSPSRGRATGSKSTYIMLPIRESPQHSTSSSVRAGWPRASPGRARRAASGRCRGRRSRTRRGSARGSSPAGSRPGGAGRGSRRSSPASGIACSSASTSMVAVLEPALVLGATRRPASCHRSCRAARPAARRPSMRSIRKNGVPSTSPVGSIQPDGRHGHVGPLADDPHRVVLVLERVVREDRELVRRRRDPGDVLAPSAARRPRSRRVEDQRLRGHAVGVDAAVQRDHRVGARGQRPVSQSSSSRPGRWLRRGASAASSGRPVAACVTVPPWCDVRL